MLLSIAVLLGADIAKYKGIRIRDRIMQQDFWFQCVVIAVAVALILLLGIWGSGYDAASFIYFQF